MAISMIATCSAVGLMAHVHRFVRNSTAFGGKASSNAGCFAVQGKTGAFHQKQRPDFKSLVVEDAEPSHAGAALEAGAAETLRCSLSAEL
jgi:hypothetical protein